MKQGLLIRREVLDNQGKLPMDTTCMSRKHIRFSNVTSWPYWGRFRREEYTEREGDKRLRVVERWAFIGLRWVSGRQGGGLLWRIRRAVRGG